MKHSLNSTFKVIWSKVQMAWVAVSEATKAHGKQQSVTRITRTVTTIAMLSGGAAIAASPAPSQLPTGGQVAAGVAAIGTNGNTMTVTQSSDRASINWNTFDIGSQAAVNFVQPSSSSVALNRVNSPNPSQIFGQLTANGQIYLMNAAGVYFAPGAQVNVGGIVATTMQMSDAAFMAGSNSFERNGATGKVINEGTIQTSLNGYIAMLAPEVRNNGLLLAQAGTVVMAAGENITLNFGPTSKLESITVTTAQLDVLVENKTAIKAPNGLVILSAKAANQLAASVVNSGTIEARGVSQQGGRILLEGSVVTNTGTLDVSSDATQAGTIQINGKYVSLSGNVVATSPVQGGAIKVSATQTLDVAKASIIAGENSGTGGQIQLSAFQLQISDSTLNADGDRGGNIQMAATISQPNNPFHDPLNIPTLPATLAATGFTSISSRGRRGQGGNATLTGDSISLDGNTNINVSGATGGGNALIGGDWQGSNVVYQANTVLMTQNVSIDASATDTGNGGKVVLWSDVANPNGWTNVYGSVYARGGAHGGSGGQVETSGGILQFTGFRVDTQAADGGAGQWLLDPYNFFFNGTELGTIATNLNSSNITLSTVASSTGSANAETFGTGYLVLRSDFNYSGSNNRTLTLNANASIWVNGNMSATGSGALGLNFNANSRVVLDGNISSQGGSVSFNAPTVNFQKASGDQSINTAGGSLTFGSSNISLSQQSGGGTVTFDTGTGALNLGSGTIDQTSTRYIIDDPVVMMGWGGRFGINNSNYNSSVKNYTDMSLVAGNEYFVRLYLWGTPTTTSLYEVQINNGSNIRYFRVQKEANGNASVTDAASGSAYLVTNNEQVEFSFIAQQTGTLQAYTTLNSAGGWSPAFELYGLTRTGLSTTSVSGTRSLTLASSTGQITSSKNVSDLASLTVNTGNTASGLVGVISGATNLFKLGTGSLSLIGANTYTGGTTINAGTLGVYTNSSMGTGAVTVAGDSSLLLGRAVTSIANNFTLNANLSISNDTNVEYLVVGGGGGGGNGWGGGGGAGGFLTGNMTLSGNSSTSVTVGSGGAAGAYNAAGSNGGDSSLGSVTAYGGGGGAGYGWSIDSYVASGKAGGSGGGAAEDNQAVSGGAGTLGQGNSGGGSASNGVQAGSGGGGAGSAGGSVTSASNSSNRMPGSGGAGLASNITGTSVVYAGGGGGATTTPGPSGCGLGGSGGGGAGACNNVAAVAGTANLGGGGGGGMGSDAAQGGSGIVIVRYLGSSAAASGSGGTTRAGTGTAAGYTLHTFTTPGASTLTLNAAAPTFSGVISGSGGLKVAATDGSITFSGASTFTGATTIAGGTVKTSNATALGQNSAVTINNTAGAQISLLSNLVIGSLAGGGATGGNVSLGTQTLTTGADGTSTTYAGVISSGSGGALVKEGSGTFTITGANTYTGDTTINAGTLIVQRDAPTFSTNSYGGAGSLIIQSAGSSFSSDVTLQGSKIRSTLGSLTLGKSTNTKYLYLSGTYATVGAQTYNSDPAHNNTTGYDTTDRGIRLQSATNFVTNNADVNLNATVWSSSGAMDLTVNAGTGNIVFGGNVGTWTGADARSLAALNLTGGAISAHNIRASSFSINNSGDSTITGRVAWSTIGMTKAGLGKLTFTNADPMGNNLYYGGLTITGGTVSASNAEAFGASGTVTLNGGNLELTGNVSLGHSVALASDAQIDVASGKTLTLSGVVSGAGNLSKLGAGTVMLSGANTYDGTTLVNAGLMAVSNATGLGGATNGTTVASGASLDLRGAAVGEESITLNGGTLKTSTGTSSLSGVVTLGSDSTVDVSGTQLTLSGIVSGTNFGLTKTGSGTLVLSGANTYSGTTSVSAGTLAISHNDGLGDTSGSSTVASGATLDLRGVTVGAEAVTLNGATLKTSSGPSSLSGAITLGGNSIVDVALNQQLTLSGVISGAGYGFSKASTGNLILTGNNTYDGTTTINAGRLQIGAGGTTGSLGVGDITNNGSLSFNLSQETSLANNISGAGTLTQQGTGKLILTGTNTYASSTTIDAGATLQVGNNTATGSLGQGNIYNSGSLIFYRSDDLTVANAISQTGALIKQGTGLLTLTGANTYSGTTTISAGKLQLGVMGNSGTLGTGSIINNAELIYNRSDDGTIANDISGTGRLTKNYGPTKLTLTGNNSYSGLTTIYGTLQIGDGGTTGALGTGSVANYGTLAFNRTDDLTVTNAISQTGALIKQGSNTLVLTGANTYAGSTTVSAGTLQIGAGSTTGTLGKGTVTNNGALVFNRSNDLTVANTISGSGSVTKSGSNTLTLTANSSYTGATTISGGVLVLANNAPTTGTSGFNGPGALRVESASTSFTGALNTSGWKFGSTLGGLTIGKTTNTQDITLADATSIAGDVGLYGGNISLNNALTTTNNGIVRLQATSGNITQNATGVITTAGLALLGGNATLNNTGNSVTALAAQNMGSLSFVNSAGLTVATVNPTGISATGPISISTQSGDLSITEAISTTSIASDAIVLNAGSSSTAGTPTGGNILFSGNGSISVGAGGRATLYTGSVADSTGVTALVGTGSGRFRYYSDETASNYTSPLGSGIYAIYRERPTATESVSNQSITYGDALPILSGSVSGTVNGDLVSYIISNRQNSSSGNIKAGSYTLTETGLAALGYNVTLTNGTLTVAQKTLSLTGLSANDKIYDGNAIASVSSYGTLIGKVSGDTVVLDSSSVNASFDAGKNVGTDKAVTISGLVLSDNDGVNYQIGSQSTTASIRPKTLTISGITASDKVYDTNTLATISTSGLTLTGIVANDAVSVSNANGSFADKNVGVGKTVRLSYTKGGADLNNYTVTDQITTTASITPKTLTVTYTGVDRVYDGSATATVTTLDDRFSGDSLSINRTANFVDSNGLASKDVAWIAGSVASKAIAVSDVALSGTDALNYSVANTGSASALITPKTVSLSASKTYDGTTDFTGKVTVLTGVGSETLAYNGARSNDANVAAVGKYINAITLTNGSGTNGGLASNYQLPSLTEAGANNSVTINKATLTVAADNQTRLYGQSNPTLTQTITGYVNDEDATSAGITGSGVISTSANTLTGVGSYAITAGTGNLNAANYDFTAATGTLTINKAALTVTANSAVKTYDGVAYSGGNGVTYSGFVNNETETTHDVLGGSLTYVGTSQGAKNAGSYVITGSGLTSGNYAITYKNGALTINKANLTLSGTRVYDSGTTFAGQYLTASGVNGETFNITGNGDNSNLASKNVADNQGVALSSVMGLGLGSSGNGGLSANYNALSTSGSSVTLTKAAATATANSQNVTYTGQVQSVSGYTVSGLQGSDTVDNLVSVSASGATGTNAGTYTNSITVGTESNYELTGVNGALTINKANLTLSGTRVYDSGTTFAGQYLTARGVNGETFNITGNGDNSNLASKNVADNQGVALSSVTGLGLGSSGNGGLSANYNALSTSGSSVTLTKAAANVTGTTTNGTYSGLTQTQSTASSSGFYVGDVITISGEATGKNAGTYTSNLAISGADAVNYSTSITNADLIIGKANLTLSGTRVYDSGTTFAGQYLTASGVNGETFNITGNGDNSNLASKNVADNQGVALSSVTGLSLGSSGNGGLSANYNALSTSGSNVTLTKAAATATANSQNVTYTGQVQNVSGYTVSGLQGSDTVDNLVSVSASGATGTNAGTYTNSITVGTESNYELTGVNGALTINKALLTVSADNKTRLYGEANPVLTQTITGYVNGEDAASAGLGGSGIASTTAVKATGVGDYRISSSVGNLSAMNYDFTAAEGTLTIGKAHLTVTANNQSRTYGAANPTFTQTITGFVNGENEVTAGITGSATGTSTANASTNVGSYTIAGHTGTLDAANYDFTAANGVLTINKALLTATGTKTYDGLISFNGSGLTVSGVNGESFTATGAATMSTKNVQTNERLASLAGLSLSDADANGASLSNYETLALANTRVSVTPLAVMLVAPDATKVYDGTTFKAMTSTELTALSKQLVGGDSVSSAQLVYNDKNAGGDKTVALNSVVVNDDNNGKNYNLSVADSQHGVITKAPLTVTVVNDAKFVTQDDTAGYGGVFYNGFVAGETAAVLTTGSVSRKNPSINAAGTYTGELEAKGWLASNYEISYRAGDYSIVPANVLLVKATPATAIYGSAPTYDLTAQYLTSSGSIITTPAPTVNGSAVSISDGVGGTALFSLDALNGSFSSSNYLRVGGYNLGATNLTIGGNNFNKLVAVGSLTVGQKTLNNNLGVQSISKVYDGSTSITGQALTFDQTVAGVLGNDVVTLSGAGSYTDRNVGTNKLVTLSMGLGGTDASNYALATTTLNDNVGTITQLASVQYIGDNGGDWSDSRNWAGGALPDGINVGRVVIPTGMIVRYNSDQVGITGSQITNNGTIQFNSANAFNLTNAVSGTGILQQRGAGMLTVSGNNTLSGVIDIGSYSLTLGSTNALGSGSVLSNGGNLSVTNGITLNQLTVNGAVNLLSTVNTTYDQTYNGPLTFMSSGTPYSVNGAAVANFYSASGNVNFMGAVSAGVGSKRAERNLVVSAKNGTVLFNNQVGQNVVASRLGNIETINFADYNQSDISPYSVDVEAKTIKLFADVTSIETQQYRGAMLVGDNGSNGNVRLLLSMDPLISITGSIDDVNEGQHTLMLRAITLNDAPPTINVNADIGQYKVLNNIDAATGRQNQDPGKKVADTSGAGNNVGEKSFSGKEKTKDQWLAEVARDRQNAAAKNADSGSHHGKRFVRLTQSVQNAQMASSEGDVEVGEVMVGDIINLNCDPKGDETCRAQ